MALPVPPHVPPRGNTARGVAMAGPHAADGAGRQSWSAGSEAACTERHSRNGTGVRWQRFLLMALQAAAGGGAGAWQPPPKHHVWTTFTHF